MINGGGGNDVLNGNDGDDGLVLHQDVQETAIFHHGCPEAPV